MKNTNSLTNSRKTSLPKRRGGTQMGILAIMVSFIGLFLIFGLLAYYHFNPEIQEQKISNRDSVKKLNTSESSAPKVPTLTDDQKRLIEAEKKRRKDEQEAERKKQLELEKKKRIEKNLKETRNAIADRKWSEAEALMEELLADGCSVSELSALTEELSQARLKEKEDIEQVDELLMSVEQLDDGKFSPEAIKLLDEALEIYPNYEPTLALKRKINGYPYSLRVPEDVATLNEAAHKLRKGDTLIVGKGKHRLSAILNKGIQIKGQGQKLTTIQCITREGSALALIGSQEVYKISNLSIEGLSYEDDALDRHPLVLVKSKVSMENVTVMRGSGHGVAVAGGTLKMSNCKVLKNSWDGVSVMGAMSSAEIIDSEITGNYEHGVDFWKGARGSLTNLKISENIASGVVVMGQGTLVKLEQVQTMRNRHCGILINSQAEASLDRVFSSENQLSGIVIQDQGTKVKCGITVSNNNLEAGFFISPLANVENFLAATSEGNKAGNVIKTDFKSPSAKPATP